MYLLLFWEGVIWGDLRKMGCWSVAKANKIDCHRVRCAQKYYWEFEKSDTVEVAQTGHERLIPTGLVMICNEMGQENPSDFSDYSIYADSTYASSTVLGMSNGSDYFP